jgi:hypothetical protein
LVTYVKQLISMDSRLDKLIASLRIAVDNEGSLDKEAMSYVDIFDALGLAMRFYRFESIK